MLNQYIRTGLHSTKLWHIANATENVWQREHWQNEHYLD